VTGTDATATSIDVLSTLALRGVLLEIADQFRTLTGLSFAATYKSTKVALNLIAQGATADMTIITREAIDRLVHDGIIVAGSTADLAQSGVGIAVRAGAPKPDIGTVAALKRTLVETKSIAFSRLGASGVHFAHVIEQLGIADEVRRKANISDSYVGELTARGEAELAVQQISELMPVAGIDIVGPLPDEVQKISVFAAGIFHAARNPGGAGKLISYLAEPRLAPVLIRKGLESVRPAPRASDHCDGTVT
jgi:molybdate transport system substrate-binding protein